MSKEKTISRFKELFVELQKDYSSEYLLGEILGAMTVLQDNTPHQGTPSDICLNFKAAIENMREQGISWARIRQTFRAVANREDPTAETRW